MFTSMDPIEVYRNLVTVTVIANEFLLPFSLWIVTPSKPPNRAYESFFPLPLLTILGYAIVEPVAYTLFAFLPVPPSFIAGEVTFLATLGLSQSRNRVAGEKILQIIANKYRGLDGDGAHKEGITPSSDAQKQKPDPPSPGQVTFAFLVPAAFLAASNAALLLVSQYLAATDDDLRKDRWWAIVVPGTVVLVSYFTCRILELSFAKENHKARFIGTNGLEHGFVQLLSLGFLMAVRGAIRTLFGLEPFMAFSSADPALARRLVERESYALFIGHFDKLFGKLSGYLHVPTYVIAMAISYPLLALGIWLLRTEERDTLKKYADWGDQYLGPIEAARV